MLKEEGGPTRSIVSEESGLLISMILRQYFMSLKVLGRWKNWGAHMGRHWGGIHEDLHDVHPVRDPVEPGSAATPTAALDRPLASGDVPSLVGKAQTQRQNHTKHQHDWTNGDGLLHQSDSEDEQSDLPAVPTGHSQRERELIVMRKVMRKWWRLAGLSGHPSMCEEVGEEFGVHWTRMICPRTEGRIKMVEGAAPVTAPM